MKSNYYFKKVGTYNLIKEIGVGSFARVFRGRHEVSGQDVAVKMIQKQSVRQENMNMIEKEIDILLKLDHPNIIKLLDFKRTVNNYYLIFEFCEYGDLDHYIKQNSDNKRLPETEVKRIVRQISKGMEKLHSLRIVHRDLKLANILVNKDFQIKLADFGFAKYSEEDQYLVSYCGTPLTMAPEVLRREKYNEKCDIWSVGIIIFQMLFGYAPFLPPKGGMINDLIQVIDTQELKFPDFIQVSDQVKQLLQGMLQRDWRERISPVQFFKSQWLQGEIQLNNTSEVIPQYLQSILRQPNDISPKQSQQNQQQQQQEQQQFQQQQQQLQQQSLIIKHKLSDDVQETDLLDRDEEIITDSEQDRQLKYLAGVISYELRNFLSSYMDSIKFLDQLCESLMNLNKQLNGQPELRNLYLAIRLLKAARLEQGIEYRREQVVVLSNQSMHSDLVSLEVRIPFQQQYEEMVECVKDLQKEFQQYDKILKQFINSHLSLADNIYDSFLELLNGLMKQEKLQLLDQYVIDNVFSLLKSLTVNPQVEATLQCKIQIISPSDMKKYWHIFGLVKSNQEKLSQMIEQGEQQHLDLGIKVSTNAIPIDQDDRNVSFKEIDLIQLQNGLLEQIKEQQVVIIT